MRNDKNLNCFSFCAWDGGGCGGGNHIKLSQKNRLEQSVRKYYRYYAFKKGHSRYLEVIPISLDLHPVYIFIYIF